MALETKVISEFGRIGVLMGGPSSEREISLKSGTAVFEALHNAGAQVVAIDIVSDDIQEAKRRIIGEKIDVAFIALHGRFGEDGTIQGALEDLSIPYTGSGVQASKRAMDKILSRSFFQAAGLATPRFAALEKSAALNTTVFFEFGFPLVVKPAANGSSIGLTIVDASPSFMSAVTTAFEFDERILIEEYIKGRELTVAVLGDIALPVIEIVYQSRFFDYAAKYTSGLTRYIAPAHLEPVCAQAVQDAAVRAHLALGCSGCSRADIILRQDGTPFVLEVNTIPGLTTMSLLPKAARLVGTEFLDLCLILIKLAYEKTKNAQTQPNVKGAPTCV